MQDLGGVILYHKDVECLLPLSKSEALNDTLLVSANYVYLYSFAVSIQPLEN